ncbi:G-type lectin S-receptor-like serine/threonine-protein kinase [Populus alba x Populus x berolinensis]|uniref:G-type lectin S-receptor-like serine/threonine-protein kinase n=1 Tax=Populus alba x Populus x berolinensis TaxID=444605 RepID=A0AAD6W1N3_9ROSI|nr:G-type lectin S-receptor-like serine/threonine-protein kinase [Populus alba x Populus x berolinensis]
MQKLQWDFDGFSELASAKFDSDTLLVGQSLSASQTLISQNGTFELGFFKRGTSVNIYLGIWYKNFADKIYVWVANRESPSNDPASSKLELSADGNLVLLTNVTKTIWSTAPASSMSNTSTAEAVLLDDGNFVVRDGSNPPTIYWQSFDYPTDTWLPGGKLGINKHTGQVQRLISWKNSEDPAPGMFSFGIDPNGSSQLFIEWNRSHRYWSSGMAEEVAKLNKREEKTERKREEEAAEQPVLFLRFPSRSSLDRAEILTAASRRVALHSGRLDRRLVAWKLAVLTENGAVSILNLRKNSCEPIIVDSGSF